jgi:hypothetical protein
MAYIRQIEAQERIAQLEAEVAELKAMIAMLRAEIEVLQGKGGGAEPVIMKPNKHKDKHAHRMCVESNFIKIITCSSTPSPSSSRRRCPRAAGPC